MEEAKPEVKVEKEEKVEEKPVEEKPVKEKKKVKTGAPSKKKLEAVDKLIEMINESQSVVIVSIKNLPTSQFQLIKKKLRDQATIQVIKKTLLSRAIDKIEKGTIKNFKKYLKEDQAIIFSKLEPFELSAILSKNKSMARAKVGQEVNDDVVIEPGPTELVPGPVISELGGLGIKFAIEDGKIEIKAKKVILKAGEEVNEAAASIMGKLDMKPVAVGLVPVVGYDAKEDKIFEDIEIDSEKIVDDLKSASAKALAFAVKIAYACKDTIGYLLAKASAEEKALSVLVKDESAEEKVEEKKEEAEPEEKKEEKVEEKTEVEEEKKEDKTQEENKPQEEK